jgi:hypothetical protein
MRTFASRRDGGRSRDRYSDNRLIIGPRAAMLAPRRSNQPGAAPGRMSSSCLPSWPDCGSFSARGNSCLCRFLLACALGSAARKSTGPAFRSVIRILGRDDSVMGGCHVRTFLVGFQQPWATALTPCVFARREDLSVMKANSNRRLPHG